MTVRVNVFNTEECGDKFPTENAVEFNDWLKDIIESVPVENRGDVKIDIDAFESYGSIFSTVEIYYYRDETEAELKEISENNERERKREVQRKRDLLDELKLELGET